MAAETMLIGLLGVLLILFGVSLGIAFFFAYRYVSLRSQPTLIDLAWREKEVERIKKEQQEVMQRESRLRFEQWRNDEIEKIRQQAVESAQKEATSQYQQ